ncbi:MAG: C4-dicarboxylate ABC transporter substrate-binding protein [Burkholderiales bacterium]|nr:C4-dicarboxylate ABC transporter substrate-binding protein [Burkholderiales bacterium]
MMRVLLGVAAALVLGLALLLFGQWPLREWLQAYSREANDIGQILFALYASAAITAASRAKTHLALVRPTSDTRPAAWRSWATLACVAPWALLVLWSALPALLNSVRQMERFSEGLTPGYFVVRFALVLLALLVLQNAVAQALDAWRQGRSSAP